MNRNGRSKAGRLVQHLSVLGLTAACAATLVEPFLPSHAEKGPAPLSTVLFASESRGRGKVEKKPAAQKRNHPCWDGRLEGMLGQYFNYTSPLKYDFNTDGPGKDTFVGFKSLGGGWVDNTEFILNWPQAQKKPSWRGGRVRWPKAFLKRARLYKKAGIEVWFVIATESPGGGRLDKSRVEAGWQDHVYNGLDREIRKGWDRKAPSGWTMLDEWRFFVRETVRFSKTHGDLIDGWYVGSEMVNPEWFTPEDAARLIAAGVEEIKAIDPDAFVTTEGTLPGMDDTRDLARYRSLFAMGAHQIDAIPMREHSRGFPESPFLRGDDWKGLRCTGLKESLECWYRLGNKWNISDPRDGRTRVMITDNWWAYKAGGKAYEYMFYDTPEFREFNANYWTRSLLLCLSTGFVTRVRGLFYRERSPDPCYFWYKPGKSFTYNRRFAGQVAKMKKSGFPGKMRSWTSDHPRIKDDSRPNFQSFMRSLFNEYKADPERAADFFDFYLEERNPTGKKPVYYAVEILMDLLARATFVGRVDLREERLYGLKFRDDETGEMITALWSVSGPAEVHLKTGESRLETLQRKGSGISDTEITPVKGIIRLQLSGNPVFVVGELQEEEEMRVSDLAHTGRCRIGEPNIFEITYRSDRDMDKGEINISFPTGWIPPQTEDADIAGYVTVEGGPGVRTASVVARDNRLTIRMDTMPNGHNLRVIYGDARTRSYLYDMGDDKYGLATIDYQKIGQNMTYDDLSRDGFDRVGVPVEFRLRGMRGKAASRFKDHTWASGGWGMPDNPHQSIYKDMAVSIYNPAWNFSVRVDSERSYLVRAYLAGPGEEDDMFSGQGIRVNGLLFDSSTDRVFRDVRPGRRSISISLEADRTNAIQKGFMVRRANCRVVPLKREKDLIKENWNGNENKLHLEVIPDDVAFCYLYGLEIIPEGLGGGPGESAERGENVFTLTSVSSDGARHEVEAALAVE